MKNHTQSNNSVHIMCRCGEDNQAQLYESIDSAWSKCIYCKLNYGRKAFIVTAANTSTTIEQFTL